jgi:polar amino acid transport system permease protein
MWSWDTAEAFLPELARGLLITVQAVVFGMLLALVLGLAWALAKRSERAWIRWPVIALTEFVRRTPLLVQLVFLYAALPEVGLDVPVLVAGTIGLGLHYSCYVAEVYRAGLESVPRGQWDAARALHLSSVQAYRHVILPQAVPPILPPLGNYLISMFKETPLLSAITVLEMLRRAAIFGKDTFRYLEPYTMVGVTYLVLSLLAASLVARLERRMATTVSGVAHV